MGLTVEELMQKLTEIIEKKPIAKKMEVFIKDGTILKAITEVKTQREQNGAPVRPFILLE